MTKHYGNMQKVCNLRNYKRIIEAVALSHCDSGLDKYYIDYGGLNMYIKAYRFFYTNIKLCQYIALNNIFSSLVDFILAVKLFK